MSGRSLAQYLNLRPPQYDVRLNDDVSVTTPTVIFVFQGATAPSGPGPPHYQGFTVRLRHTTVGRTPLDEWSARRRDLYLTTQNIHKRQTSMLPAGFESATPASEQPYTHALDRVTTGIGCPMLLGQWNKGWWDAWGMQYARLNRKIHKKFWSEDTARKKRLGMYGRIKSKWALNK
jgi:hypothetical protein